MCIYASVQCPFYRKNDRNYVFLLCVYIFCARGCLGGGILRRAYCRLLVLCAACITGLFHSIILMQMKWLPHIWLSTCGLLGVVCPWFSFWRHIYIYYYLLLYIVCFLTYPFFLHFFLIYLLPYLSFPLGIDPLHFRWMCAFVVLGLVFSIPSQQLCCMRRKTTTQSINRIFDLFIELGTKCLCGVRRWWIWRRTAFSHWWTKTVTSVKTWSWPRTAIPTHRRLSARWWKPPRKPMKEFWSVCCIVVITCACSASAILAMVEDSTFLILLFTARCYASAVLAMGLCPSVCPCPSVTSRSSTKTAKHRITQTTPHDTPKSLVFWCQRSPRNSTGVTPYGGAKCRWGGSKSATFDK